MISYINSTIIEKRFETAQQKAYKKVKLLISF